MISRTRALLVVLALSAGAAAQSVPTGFTDDLVVSGISNVVGIAFAPDGRIFATSRLNYQVWCCLTSGVKTMIGTVPLGVGAGSERGLLGIVVDPNFPASPYIYVEYSRSGGMAVSRFTITGTDLNNPGGTSVSLGSRYDILTGLPDSAFNHNGGTVRFDSQGFLYASFGDDASSCTAQSLGDGRGEIYRMDVSALPAGAGGPPATASIVAAGNPFPTAGARGPLVWAYGLRNPFRFNIDTAGGGSPALPIDTLYIADVGLSSWEEMDMLTPATPAAQRNCGWPWKEGNAAFTSCGGSPPQSLTPFATLSASSGAHSIVSMPLYRNVTGGAFNFGTGYEGNVFFVDYFQGIIKRMQWNGSGWLTAPAAPGQPAGGWGVGYQSLSDAIMGPDGAIYYAKHTSGQIRRIKSDANAPHVNVVSGNGQIANQGQTLPLPFRVQVVIQGVPQSGVQVTYSASTGSFSSPTVTTDANGFAESTYTLDPVLSASPVITANVPSGVPATFNATWRGLSINYIPLANLAVFTMRHSQNNSPISIIYDLPHPAPVLILPWNWGSIWVDFITPTGTAWPLVDGLGLVGPPMPSIVTNSTTATWSNIYSSIAPLGGLTLTFQGFAVDTSLLPNSSAIVITDKVDVTFN